MKLLYVVTGIGYGDATREHCNIISMKKKYPKANIMVAGYDNSYTYFQDKYPTIKIRGYKLPGKSLKINVIQFGLRNIFLPAFWFIGTLKVRLEAFNFIPDVIITDFEPVGISLARVLRKKCVIVFAYDPQLYKEYAKHHRINYKMQIEATYFEKLYDQADLVIIPSFRKKKKQKLLYNYVNPVVRIKPEELPDEKTLMKELKLKRKPILVMLGGSEFGTKLAKHIIHLSHDVNEDFIIFGGNLEHMHLHKRTKYFRYTPDFLKYLKVCKGIITLAGHKTLSEALIYKKPILCFPIQDHIEQILNAYALRDTIMVSHQSTYKHIKKIIPQFIKRTKEIQKNVASLKVKSNGSEQITELVNMVYEKQKRKRRKKSKK